MAMCTVQKRRLQLITALACICFPLAYGTQQAASFPIAVVDLQIGALSVATTVAVQVCAGLMNRNVSVAGAAYTLMRAEDAEWLAIVQPSIPSPPTLTPVDAFLATCFKVAAGYLRYNYSAQQALVPNLLTVAAVLGAVPLEDGSPYLPTGTPLLFDAVTAWAGFNALNATAAVYAAYGPRTTTMAMMDPGYDYSADPLAPVLTRMPDLGLADYIVSARLFNFFMVGACINGSDEHVLMETMVRERAAGAWPRPIAVLGYNDALPIAGDIFEAETDCVSSHGIGQVATSGVNNLAFFSTLGEPITRPLQQPAVPSTVFNASKTYLGLVVGDGDNIAMVKTDRFHWFADRLAACTSSGRSELRYGAPRCYPVGWSLSPHLLTLAPDMARWFYAGAAATGADYFVLPPSGHLYAYPSQMQGEDSADFIAATEADCVMMNCSSTVAWEFAGTWPNALADYFPRYGAVDAGGRAVVTAFFAVNVPYMIPVVEFGADEYAKVLHPPPNATSVDPVVVFKPNEWRGTTGGAVLPPFMLNATAFAALINAYPRGTVAHIYMTSDGGAKLADFDDLVALLDPHVEVVAPSALAPLAIESERLRGRGT